MGWIFFYIRKIVPIELKFKIPIHIIFTYLSFKSYVPVTFILAAHSHDGTNSTSIFDHMKFLSVELSSGQLWHVFFFKFEKLLQSSSKFKNLFILYIPIYHPNLMSLGLLFWPWSSKNAAILDPVWLIDTWFKIFQIFITYSPNIHLTSHQISTL